MLLQTMAASDCATALSARAGVGLKLDHAVDVLNGGHGVGFFEVHAENYMGAGGEPHRLLNRVRDLLRYRCTVSDYRSAAPARFAKFILNGSSA